ncbi:hypothetical protein QTJ16_001164 [Diplocarpon rosae]|uniref:Oxidoreductase FAD/NAD(P)-binding domain-containing protein n=1 Tax=Diplocarpon rosae TaxID=946125 RepID=A0AAD9T7M6_9HELO|nr:hypothetical protein QTJ16_001164 [Diplocarpon rosae]
MLPPDSDDEQKPRFTRRAHRRRTARYAVSFTPGQWVDLYIPHLPSPGGFTLTSVPSTPDLELAVQRPRASSPSATPASWLWQPPSRILHTRLQVRVGGRFVWPPLAIPRGGIRRVVFVAGGVGINPLISMLTSIVEEEEEEERERIGSREGARPGLQVRFLYSVRSSPEGAGGGEVLFLSRLRSLCKTLGEKGSLRFFVTGEGEVMNAGDLSIKRRRMTDRDVEDALGDVEERSGTVCYVCGVPGMTDEFVEIARQAEGMDGTRVLSEKWW